ncbi:MAG: hypothetical protein AMJ60_01705 [Desulfobacterales bacterium SG8_35]|nr:MAG: hypothetical protein AMJ60_01705 [Desulfobacterales bacterium SG8_35]
MLIFFYSSTFSLFARKKKYEKERAADHLSRRSGMPCAARKMQTPWKAAALRRVVFLLFAALLGCVKWQEVVMVL